jgi:hypothetical protein
MKRLLAGLALLALHLGCSGSELPTVELGGGGVRVMNGQGRTPLEAYDIAYSTFTRQHHSLRRSLDSASRNLFAARSSLEESIKALKIMQSIAVEADRPKFEPFVAKYAEFLKEMERGTWGGSWSGHLDLAERDARAKLHPNQINVPESWATEAQTSATPKASAPVKTPEAPAKPSGDVVSADKVEIPAARPATPAATPPPSASTSPAPPKPSPPAGVSIRLLFKAYDRAHDDLVATYKDKKDCRQAYDDVVQSLRLLKDAAPAEKAAKIQIYLDYYADLQQKTRGFTILPEKTSEKDVVEELGVAARVLRKELNPDR